MDFNTATEENKNAITKNLFYCQEWLKNNLKMTTFLFWGTLLGIIRDKDFISYDHDIDLVYLSPYKKYEHIKEELQYIYQYLQKNELLVKVFKNKGQVHIKTPLKDKFIFDLWVAWIENGYFCVTSSNGIMKISQENLLLPLYPIKFRGYSFLVPNNSEKLLKILYGNNWKVPINWKINPPIDFLTQWIQEHKI